MANLNQLKKTAQGTVDGVVLRGDERQHGDTCRLESQNQQSGHSSGYGEGQGEAWPGLGLTRAVSCPNSHWADPSWFSPPATAGGLAPPVVLLENCSLAFPTPRQQAVRVMSQLGARCPEGDG